MFYYLGRAIQTVGFFGLGRSNLGILNYLSEKYPRLEFTLRASESVKCDGIFKKCFFGKDCYSSITEDILFLSPSVRRDHPELLSAAERGTILSSDAEFFFLHVTGDVYTVTGSDGKSTTTYLLSRLLSDTYGSVGAIGNIGVPMTPELWEQKAAYSVELSSFQLMPFMPRSRRAVVTNVTENHLNWHTSFDEYIAAKKNAIKRTDGAVLNFDCPITRSFAEDVEPFCVFSSELCEAELRRLIRAEIYVTLSRGHITVSGEELLDTALIRARGRHNVLNFMAAVGAAYGKFKKSSLIALANDFQGLFHRRELIHTSGGVRYFDSSIDSSPKRCIATLDSFPEKVILILGGRSKGLDFSPLAKAVARHAKRAVIYGECRDEIKEALTSDAEFLKSGIQIDAFPGFREAVCCATSKAESGDTVLLSPAATSYGEFRSFEERGDIFKKIIKEITK